MECMQCGEPCRWVLCEDCYQSAPMPAPEQSQPREVYVPAVGLPVVADGKRRM